MEELFNDLSIEKIRESNLKKTDIEDLLKRLNPEKVFEYLTPDFYIEANFTSQNFRRILNHFGEKLYPKYNISYGDLRINPDPNIGIAEIIIAREKDNIEKYLTLENIKKYKLDNEQISKLINELDTEKKEKYLFKNQKNTHTFTIANIIKLQKSEKIEDCFDVDKIKEYNLNSSDIGYLMLCLDEETRKKYLLPEQENEEFGLLNIYYYHSSEKKKDIISKIYKSNRKAFQDSCSILENDYLFEKFDEDAISYISCFSKESNELAKLNNITIDLISKLLEKFQQDNAS